MPENKTIRLTVMVPVSVRNRHELARVVGELTYRLDQAASLAVMATNSAAPDGKIVIGMG